MWEFSTPVFESMHLDKCTLTILNPTTEHHWKKKEWQTEATNNFLRDEWSLTLKITIDNEILGQLTVWKISEGYPVRDIFNQLDTLRDALAEELDKLLKNSIKSTH